ncbi:isochorismate synthase [Domibacillus indicus]|uniref:isochorismate synthase n=1 Tax=Domibacillus indicus TaxID=1437523 RepID=UPI0009E1DA18|nr:isochorismate synthase [Domibacillus indicus]
MIKGHPLKGAFVEFINDLNGSTLFSYVEKVEKGDPLRFYENGKEWYQGERFYFKDRDGERVIAGLGSVQTIQSGNSSRFKDVEAQWDALMARSSIHNPYNIYGTGPVAFGGFSFDPLRSQGEEWSRFAPSFFYVPELMMTAYGDETYVTVNLVCEDVDSKFLFDRIEERKQMILSGRKRLSEKEAVLMELRAGNTEGWKKSVQSAVDTIKKDAELKKVVLARKVAAAFDGTISPDRVLRRLDEGQPDSFIFSIEAMDSCFLGASPERLVKKRAQTVLTTCLAGSTARGVTASEDAKLAEALLNDDKNRIEHDYVVQMIREEMQSMCRRVSVPDAPAVMKIRDIQHLYTPVVGEANEEDSILRFVETLHPTPALGGLPGEKALKVIRDLEEMDRGFYAAPVGWMDYRKNGEFAVAIRSGLIVQNEAFLYAGCGVVADSNPEKELEETNMKLRPMLRAIGGGNE